MRLIDADEVKQFIYDNGYVYANTLDDFPTIDPFKHGKWIFVAQRFCDGGFIDIFRCSCCGIPHGKESRYCPNCGARMDGGEET